MDAETVGLVTEAFLEERIDLVVTMPEEPTYPLTSRLRDDSRFESYTVPSEGTGIAFTAAASLGGRRSVFVTGIAGLLVGGWALSQMGPHYSMPLFIMASYRGDFSDHSPIPGTVLGAMGLVGEPLLNALRIPYRIADEKRTLKRMVRDAHSASRRYDTPTVLLLTGEVLW
jgi:sulfopyruvate decarboxylase subunit alpha